MPSGKKLSIRLWYSLKKKQKWQNKTQGNVILFNQRPHVCKTVSSFGQNFKKMSQKSTTGQLESITNHNTPFYSLHVHHYPIKKTTTKNRFKM